MLLETLLQLSVSVSTNMSSKHKTQINDFRIASEEFSILNSEFQSGVSLIWTNINSKWMKMSVFPAINIGQPSKIIQSGFTHCQLNTR